MQIYGTSQLHGAQAISAPHAGRTAVAPSVSQSYSMSDELQISDAGRLVEQAKQLPDVRFDRVNALRTQIAGGTYETGGKLSVAIERLLDEIG
ncbi:MAG TPA: flagellar biosynthesis anti-sigma factor FlgM [Pirellulales bacterium]|nr:flagellar biosynthesis anti-sigma factor FlgM [Pirellulales bacterium]